MAYGEAEESESAKDGALCVTFTAVFAMFSTSLSGPVPVFGGMATSAVPVPEPWAGDWIPNTVGLDPGSAAQMQPGGAVTVTGRMPPNAAGFSEVGLTE
jgi:hypothetical protein